MQDELVRWREQRDFRSLLRHWPEERHPLAFTRVLTDDATDTGARTWYEPGDELGPERLQSPPKGSASSRTAWHICSCGEPGADLALQGDRRVWRESFRSTGKGASR